METALKVTLLSEPVSDSLVVFGVERYGPIFGKDLV
jgi:hypothetical protein